MMCLKHPLTVPSTCQSLPGMKWSRKPKWGVVKSECESWLHCLALGKGLLHSVPEFPRVYKTNPSNFIKHLLRAKVFYSCLVPQPALRRLELASSPPFTDRQRRPDEGQRLVPQLLGESHAARPCCGPCQQGSLNAA